MDDLLFELLVLFELELKKEDEKLLRLERFLALFGVVTRSSSGHIFTHRLRARESVVCKSYSGMLCKYVIKEYRRSDIYT